jgi:antitoxin CcdA
MPRSTATAVRRPTNVSLDGNLLTAAKELGINVSRACEQGLSEQIAKARSEQWLEENREALQSWNDYVDKHGLPLARYRQF